MEVKNLEDLKPFEQRPYWDPNAKFVFSGSEFERLFNVLQPFLGLALIFQKVMDENIKNGTIQVKYEYVDGSGEISEEEVKSLVELMQQKLRDQDKEKKEVAEPVETDEKVKPLITKS